MTIRLEQIASVFDGSVVNKDLQIAEDFSKMAEMGYIDKEFTMFGAAFLDTGSSMRYIISSKKDEIYRFIESCPYSNTGVSPVRFHTEICPVPSGYEADIAQQVKIRLAKELQASYKKDLFLGLQPLVSIDGNDSVYAILLEWLEKAEDLFDKDILFAFEGLLDLAYKKKLLTKRSLGECSQRLRKIHKQMEDDMIMSDTFEKNFYGVATLDAAGDLKYTVNAQYASIVDHILNVQEQGGVAGPIFWLQFTP
ncbi:MAG: hypothetical protein LBK56_03760 [Gracilibacteraceae bacterium]|jgi:hypothetical protein|nr:hypothetical protein [Gracilibacteraceae bacterium]